MKNILVTGAHGQLGHCIKDIIKERIQLNNNYIFVGHNELNITDGVAVHSFVKEKNINCIINCAAYTDVNKAEEDHDGATMVNEFGPRYLAKAMKSVDGRLIHISTDYVYSEKCTEGLKPFEPIEIPYNSFPLNFYGQSKLNGERAILSSGCKSTIIRTSWLYSEYGNNFVKKIIFKLKEGKDFPVVVDEIGCPTYALNLASFIVDYCEEFMNNNDEKQNNIINFCDNGVCSRYDFAKAIQEMTKLIYPEIIPSLTPTESIVKRLPFSVMNNIEPIVGYNYSIPYWRDSLRNCIKKIKY